MSLSTLFFVATLIVSAENYNIVFNNKEGDKKLGLYYVGNPTDDSYIAGTEIFTQLISPNDSSAQSSNFGDRFVIRGLLEESRPSFRLGVSVIKGLTSEGTVFPYGIQFQAIGLADDASLELKHRGTKGDEFIWIEPGHTVAHFTTAGDEFVVRKSNTDIVGITVLDAVKDEL